MPPKYMPGERRKKSTVTIEMDAMDAAIFLPEKLEKHRKTDLGDTIIEQDYIVSTRRFDGRFSHKVTVDGVEWSIPHKVFRTLERQVKSIIKEERSERGKAQAEARKYRQEEESWDD